MSKLLALRTKAKKTRDQVSFEIAQKYSIQITRDQLINYEKRGDMPLKTAVILASYYGVAVEDVSDYALQD